MSLFSVIIAILVIFVFIVIKILRHFDKSSPLLDVEIDTFQIKIDELGRYYIQCDIETFNRLIFPYTSLRLEKTLNKYMDDKINIISNNLTLQILTRENIPVNGKITHYKYILRELREEIIPTTNYSVINKIDNVQNSTINVSQEINLNNVFNEIYANKDFLIDRGVPENEINEVIINKKENTLQNFLKKYGHILLESSISAVVATYIQSLL